jgi:tetratricopeptide (TPR) repeat protein
MKPIITFFACLFSVGVFGQDLSTALKYASSEQYEEAEKVFQDLLAADPNNGDIYYYFGETLLKDYLSDTFSNSMDEFASKAEELFQKGIQQAPANVLNQVGMGAVTLLRTSDTTKADTYFSKAEAVLPIKKKSFTPEFAIIATKLAAAQLYGKVNRYEKAIAYLNRAAVINPTDPNIFITMGDVYIKQNDASKALFNYNKALSLEPSSPLPKIKIGNIYMRVPNLTAARPYFEEAKEIDSTFAPVYRSLGELYTLAGRHDLAKQNYQRYLQLSDNNTPAKVRYGNSLFRSKDYAGALEVIEEVLQVDNSRNYLNRLAAYSSFEKRPPDLEKALTYVEKFLDNAKPENIIPRDYAYYGRILYRLAKGDSVMLDKAFAQLRKAYEMDPSDKTLLAEMELDYYYSQRYKDAVEMHVLKSEDEQKEVNELMLIGKAYYQMEALQEADSVFTLITKAQPDNIQAYLWIARTYSKMDPSSEEGLAEPKFASMISKIGQDTVKYKQELSEAFSYMANYYYQKKEYNTAREWAGKIYGLDPNNKEWQIKGLNFLGMISYREKDYVETRNVYQKLLLLDPGNSTYKQFVSELTKVIEAAKRQN